MTIEQGASLTPLSIRVIGVLLMALLGVVVTTGAAIFLVGALNAPVILALAVMLAGWLGVAIVNAPAHPFRSTRIVAVFCTILALVLLYGSTLPPSSIVNSVFWIVVAVLAVCTMLDIPRPKRRTRWFVALLGVLGFFAIVRAFLVQASAVAAVGPSVTVAYVLVNSAGIAALSVVWHARRVFQKTAEPLYPEHKPNAVEHPKARARIAPAKSRRKRKRARR